MSQRQTEIFYNQKSVNSQDDVTNISIYVPNNRAWKDVKQKLTRVKKKQKIQLRETLILHSQ